MKKSDMRILIGVAAVGAYLWWKKQNSADGVQASAAALQSTSNAAINAVRAAQGQSPLP